MKDPTLLKNLSEILIEKKDCESIALVQEGREVTYKELYEASRRLSGYLPCNCQVAVRMSNSIEYVIALFAIFFAHSTAVLISPELTEEEVRAIAAICDVAFVLDEQSQRQIYETNVFHEPQPHRDNPTAVIIPTSGTTSMSKMVMLSHSSLLWGIRHTMQITKTRQDCHELVVLSFCTRTALEGQLFCGLFLGKKIYLFDSAFNPVKFFHEVEKQEINHCSMVPSMVRAILEFSKGREHKLDSLVDIIAVGEKMSEADIQRFHQTFVNTQLLFGYGMTETGAVSFRDTSNYGEEGDFTGRIDMLDQVKVTIADPDRGTELAGRGQKGEIVVRSPGMFSAYYKYESSHFREGKMYTGDIGLIDSGGRLYVCGRKKNMINTGGRKVFPEEVENVLNQYEKIKESCVYGREDQGLGEQLWADLVWQENCVFEREELNQYLKKHLAPYKIPKRIRLVPELAKTKTNKIKRNVGRGKGKDAYEN